MKQRMEIIVMTEVDNEKFNQLTAEKAIAEAIKITCKEVLGCAKKNTTVDIEYGDTV